MCNVIMIHDHDYSRKPFALNCRNPHELLYPSAGTSTVEDTKKKNNLQFLLESPHTNEHVIQFEHTCLCHCTDEQINPNM